MLGRIRSSLTGEPSSPDKSPKPQVQQHAQNSESTITPRPGFLPPFFNSPQPNNNGIISDQRRLTASPKEQQQQRSFFGYLAGANSPSPVPASPGTIRASASALLKLATPPLSNDNSSSNAHPEMNPNALNDGVDNVDLAKRDTLEYQINRRDAYITKLQSDLQRMQSQLSQYTKDNNTLRRQQLESTHRHGIAIKLWRRTNDGLNARVECFENETTPTAAREIANLIRDAAPPNKDSAYLMMLQDQLNKATVKLDHLGSQTEIVLHKGEEVVESLREEMNEVIRERCRMELELLDQEQMLEDEMRRMVMKTERRLKRVQGEIDYLEKNAVDVLKNQEDSEGSENEDGREEGIEGDTEKEEDESENLKENDTKNEDTDNEKEVTASNETVDDSGDASATEKVEAKEKESEEDDDESSGSSDSSHSDKSAESESKIADDKQTPETLRTELRKLAMERDRTLSVLQKKLREKNGEYHTLMRLKGSRQKAIDDLQAEKADREEWEKNKSANEHQLLP